MEQFQERLARLAELSPEELDALEAELVAAFDAADEAADLESMQQLADALDMVRAAKAEAAAPAGEAEAPTMAPVPASGSETPPEEPLVEEEPDVSDTPTDPEPEAPAEEPSDPEETTDAPSEEPAEPTDGEPAEASADAEVPETTPAAEPANEPESEEPVAEITADDVPEDARPVSASVPVLAIRAGGDIPGVTAGSTLPDMDAVNEAMVKKINSMRGISGDGEHIIVASMQTEASLDEDRILRPGDLSGNSRKIREFLANKDLLTPEGLTAGGWCAPRAPIYEVPTVGSTRRPVRDALPSFNADRGGIVWAEPPNLPAITDGAVGLWRYVDDETGWRAFGTPDASDASAADKPCLTVVCGDERSVDVDAITLCLCFDNMTTRAFPEWVRANTDLTMVAQARFAEQWALAQMFAVASTGACGTPTTAVGAARDFFFTVRAAAAQLRWRLRLDADAPLQLLAPSWVAEAMAIDLGLQTPGDGTYATSLSEIRGVFNEANVDPIWYIDDAPGTAAFNSCSFPTTAHWLLFPTGSFIRLDTGELNLGVVRSKEDMQRNKYCEFSETFEAVAYMGPSLDDDGGWVIRGLTEINLFGSHGIGIDLTT